MTFRDENLRFAEQFRLSADALTEPTIAIELPAASAARSGDVAAFALAVNLLSRTFIRVSAVFPPGVPLGPHPWELGTVDELVAAVSATTEGALRTGAPGEADVSLSIGQPGDLPARRKTFVSATAWRAALDLELEGGGQGVLGPLYAACLGAAQVLLHCLDLEWRRHGPSSVYRPMPPFEFSLLTNEIASIDAPTPAVFTLPDTHIVGVGAVGSALVYALGHFRDLRGELFLIDNESVDIGNLGRYILMTIDDVGLWKAEAAATRLSRTGLVARPVRGSFNEYVSSRGPKIDLLLSLVDSEEGRRQLATHLPKRVLNAATGGTTVTVSRHGFADGKACLHCLYLSNPNVSSPEETMAADMGLPVALVRELLGSNAPVDAELAAQIELNRGVPAGSYAEKVGYPIDSFYQRAVCSDANIQLPTSNTIAPLSFISAIPGILLAAEVLKEAHPQLREYLLDNYLRIDTLQPPNAAFHRVRIQDPSGQCICWDADYTTVYRRRYGGAQ